MDYLNTVPTVLNAKLLKLADFPQVGKAVTEIDVTGNKISTLPPSLPDTLKSLTITGNFISALPSYLSRLPSLEVLHASTNWYGGLLTLTTAILVVAKPVSPAMAPEVMLAPAGLAMPCRPMLRLLFATVCPANASIKDADIIFRCPALLHASLAYNSIARLALPTEALAPGTHGAPQWHAPPSKPGAVVPISSQLKLVNLSHNDLVDLRGTLRALSCLPCLVSLLLVGNPLVLCEGYRTRTASALPSLEQLDGCKVAERDDASGNAESSGSGGADRGSNDAKVELRISLTGLETPHPHPRRLPRGRVGMGLNQPARMKRGARQPHPPGPRRMLARARTRGQAARKAPKATQRRRKRSRWNCPPRVLRGAAAAAQGDGASNQRRSAAQAARGRRAAKEEGAEPVVEAPLLEHDDVFPVGVPVRNVLRDGFKLILLKTERTPPPPKPEGAPEMDPDPAKDPANWKVATSELGWVVLKFPQLLDGQTREVKRTVAFVRPQPLFNDAKVLLAMDKQHLLSAYDNGQSKAPADSNREPITETSWHAGRVMVTTAVQPWTDD
eukprot:jgi/Mesvir1/23046/Mv08163-RA.1